MAQQMPNADAVLSQPCYDSHGHLGWGEKALAKPSDEVFVENLNRLAGSKRGVNAELARYCGVNRSLITRWREGSLLPSVGMLGKIAAYFSVPVTALFLDTTDERTTGFDLETALRMVNDAVHNKGKKNS